MFFQETTPDTSGYMIAGYAIAFIVMALYVASIYLRTRNLNQDMTMLEEMDKPAHPVQTSPPPQPRKSPAKSGANKSAKTVTKKSRQK
ncbi:MAG: hypothetical protein EHM33_09325 [Chloroflexi bacterium]|jgi:hypothetical protein|nr:MAG: hypothetical protein EHM33_09325 [Chloroflexota bacterium]